MMDLVYEWSENKDILERRPKRVDFDDRSLDLEYYSKELFACMKHYNGVGISANQVGLNISMFTMYTDNGPITVVNPRILESSEELEIMNEGCLSYPGLWLPIGRPKSIAVSFHNTDGSLNNAYFNGFQARVFQHEMEHMLGKNFTRHVGRVIMSSARNKQRIFLRKKSKEIKRNTIRS